MIRTFKCEVDIAYTCTLAEFLEYIKKYDSPRVIDYMPEGPGGGNPCLILEFMSRDMCVKFLNAHYPGDDDKFIQSQIF